MLVEITEKLCDLSMEQMDVSVKDVVLDKITMAFTQCFSDKLRAAYAKVDDSESSGDAGNNQADHSSRS